MPDWKNRIVETAEMKVSALKANPKNWRKHPTVQQNALAGILDEVGWVTQVIWNRRTGHLIDGHLRVDLAAKRKEKTVPVNVVDLSEEEEAMILATFDPIAAMAEADKQMLAGLMQSIATENEQVAALIESIAREEKIDIGGDGGSAGPRPSLADRFVVPPFSVLDARQGYWQERKRAWVGIGIRSGLGRADGAEPGGSARPAADYSTKARGSGSGRRMPSTSSRAAPGEAPTCRQIRDNASDEENGASLFDPVLCEIAYRWFSPEGGAVLDPFAGGSVRGIVASILGRRYTGVDLSARQIAANETQAATVTPDAPPRWIVGDSREIATLAPGTYDLIFSCPPYADLEVYSDDPQDISTLDYPAFIAAYRQIIAACAGMLAPDRFAVFVVGDVRDKKGNYRNFVADTVAAWQGAGLSLYNEAILVTAVGSLPIRIGKQFSSGRKLGKTHQNVLVFVKGDGKRAAGACGPVVVEEMHDMTGKDPVLVDE